MTQTVNQKDGTVEYKDLTYGEKAVGVSFNVDGYLAVSEVKRAYADLIDKLNALRESAEGPEKKRMYSIAITEAQSSVMWAVKAITWKY